MAWELTPIDASDWSVTYNDVLYRFGDLVSTTGSETNIFPSGDANTVISDWIDKALNWMEESTGKSSSNVSDTEEIDDWKDAIIARVGIRIYERAMGQRLSDDGYRRSCEFMIRRLTAEAEGYVARQKTYTGLVDYQEVEETWS